MPGLSCGIVGLPNVGKSTLFNAVTASQVSASNYPFCTIEPNVGVVEVDDERLKILADLSKSEKIIYATTEFVDIAGLVKGASKGEGLGNAFLKNIRETDAIIHVVRCFESEDIIHVHGHVDPVQDIEVINLELLLSDMALIENIRVKVDRQAKTDKTFAEIAACLEKAQTHLNQNFPLRTLVLTPDERAIIDQYNFITIKPVLYAANVAEQDLNSNNNVYLEKVRAYAANENSIVIPICAKIEEEIAQLKDPEDRTVFLESVGLQESGLQRLIRASFELLGLITYIATGEKETRAWTIKKGMTAQEAAGKIHSDIARGFIRAEVLNFEDIVEHGSRVKAKEAGKVRSEGKTYIVKDGDIMLFLHSS